MPHRTTYFFPRQFPDYHLPPQKLNQEQQPQSSPTFNADNDVLLPPSTTSPPLHENKSPLFTCHASTTTTTPSFLPNFHVHHDVTLPPHQKGCKKQRQPQRPRPRPPLPAFCHWLIDNKNVATDPPPLASSRSPSDRYGGACEPLLLSHEEQVVDRGFDQQLSFPRVSSFGSTDYATSSYFSGSTVRNGADVSSSDAVQSATRRGEEDIGVAAAAGGDREREKLVQMSRESYYLQLTLAKRLTLQTGLVELVVSHESEGQWCTDPEILSYRLWVV